MEAVRTNRRQKGQTDGHGESNRLFWRPCESARRHNIKSVPQEIPRLFVSFIQYSV